MGKITEERRGRGDERKDNKGEERKRIEQEKGEEKRG